MSSLRQFSEVYNEFIISTIVENVEVIRGLVPFSIILMIIIISRYSNQCIKGRRWNFNIVFMNVNSVGQQVFFTIEFYIPSRTGVYLCS